MFNSINTGNKTTGPKGSIFVTDHSSCFSASVVYCLSYEQCRKQLHIIENSRGDWLIISLSLNVRFLLSSSERIQQWWPLHEWPLYVLLVVITAAITRGSIRRTSSLALLELWSHIEWMFWQQLYNINHFKDQLLPHLTASESLCLKDFYKKHPFSLEPFWTTFPYVAEVHCNYFLDSSSQTILSRV